MSRKENLSLPERSVQRHPSRGVSIFFSNLLVLGALATGCQSAEDAHDEEQERGFALPDEGNVGRGQAAFVELRCTTCHQVSGLEDALPRPTATPPTGVKLGGLAMREPTDGELVTSIIHPTHRIYPAGITEEITSGSESRMANLNQVMTVEQLIDLVAFLHDRYETTP